MNIKTIIHATDFSECSNSALQYATAFAVAEGARLLIVHVDDETPGLVIGDVGYGYLPQVDKIAQQQLDKLNRITPPFGNIACEHHLLRGNVADEVIQFSRDRRADLIVIGTHGTSGLGELLMGSVAEEIVRKAPCPVLTVRSDTRSTPSAHSGSESVVRA